jgi:hypothetical protein
MIEDMGRAMEEGLTVLAVLILLGGFCIGVIGCLAYQWLSSHASIQWRWK